MLIKVSEKDVINDIRGTYEGRKTIEKRGEKYKKRFREGEGGPRIYIITTDFCCCMAKTNATL